MSRPRPLKVWLVCTGTGVVNRGSESLFRDCFDGLKGTPGLRVRLFKGGGPAGPGEHNLWHLSRAGPAAAWAGRRLRRSPYVVEQVSSFVPFAAHIVAGRPDVIYYAEVNLGMLLYRLRHAVGGRFVLVYTNGGPGDPPYLRTDFVHQCNPVEVDRGRAAGTPADRQHLLPQGLNVPPGDPVADPAARAAAKARLGLPASRPVLLCCGWISEYHKRAHYVVDEVARVPSGRRPFVMLLGQMDEKSGAVVARARDRLGPDGFAARSVPYEQVGAYYGAADAFTLGSLTEGFGRVFVEALVAGLPAAVHDYRTMRYVFGPHALFGDFTRPGGLADLIPGLLAEPLTPAAMAARRAYARDRFGWDALAPRYADMFRAAHARGPWRDNW